MRTLRFRPIAFAASALLAAGVVLTGCYKAPEFVNPVYNCGCGSLQFEGANYPLKMSEAVIWDTLQPKSRRYHLVADLRTPEEIERHTDGHDLTVMLEFDSINRPAFYLPADGIVHRIEKIDHRSGFTATRRFVCVNGVVAPSPALLGGTETVNFEMLLREVVGDDTVGFEIPFSGSFSTTID